MIVATKPVPIRRTPPCVRLLYFLYLLCFHLFAASLAHRKRSTPLQSVLCRLFLQNQGGYILQAKTVLSFFEDSPLVTIYCLFMPLPPLGRTEKGQPLWNQYFAASFFKTWGVGFTPNQVFWDQQLADTSSPHRRLSPKIFAFSRSAQASPKGCPTAEYPRRARFSTFDSCGTAIPGCALPFNFRLSTEDSDPGWSCGLP